MKRSTTMEERFWARVNKKSINSCWLWNGARTQDGYGTLGIKGMNGKMVYAHRFSFELHCIQIPKGMCVCHSCDTPSCVNPSHLFLGTPRDNIQNASSKHRMLGPRKLTTEQVTEIKMDSISTQAALAMRYGVTRQNISLIRLGLIRKHG